MRRSTLRDLVRAQKEHRRDRHGAVIAHRRREEVLNVLLAECICDTGITADPENILKVRSAREIPDVMITLQGLRCLIDGKYEDDQNALRQVEAQVRDRLESGLSHIGIGVIYPKELREFQQFQKLKTALQKAALRFFISTECQRGEWLSGNLHDLLEELRRHHSILAKDDVVLRSVELLRGGMERIVRELMTSSATCERLTALMGVYEEVTGESDDIE